MTTVQRFDVSPLKAPTFTPQGFLKADAYATRVGIFKYQMMDGTVRRELRPPEEVFENDSIKTLSQLPVTNDHPYEAVTADNAKDYQVGFTGNAENADPFVKVDMTVTDKDSIAEVMDKRKDEVSCGYACEVDLVAGEWQGQPYDCVQRRIRYNHLAIVPMGRAGADCRIKVDRADGVGIMIDDEKKTSRKTADQVHSDGNEGNDKKQGANMAKIKIDKVEYELPEGVAPVVSAKLDALDEANKETADIKGKLDAAEGKLDATTAELKKAQDELKVAQDSKPTDVQMIARAKARLELETFSTKIVGDEAKFDDMTDAQVKGLVVAKVFPDTDLKEKTDEYVSGAFEIIRQGKVEGSDVGVKDAIGRVGTETNTTDSEKSRKDAMENNRNAWKPAEGK